MMRDRDKIIKGRRAIEEFRTLIANPDEKEQSWQTFFNENPYVLTESLPLRLTGVYPQVILESGIPDYVFCEPGDLDPLLGFHGIIEIKRPVHNILRVYSTHHLLPSNHLITAQKQTERYLADLAKGKVLDKRFSFSFGGTGYVFIIIGDSRDVVRKCQGDILQSQFRTILPTGFQIVPYDSLLASFERSLPEQPRVFLVKFGITNLRETWTSEMGKTRGVWTERERGESESSFRGRHLDKVLSRKVSDPPASDYKYDEW